MKRFLGLFLSIFLSISAICGIGLSAFFFNDAKTTTPVDNVEKKVDNIEENYDLAGVSEESNYYTVYFFPQDVAYLQFETSNGIESYEPITADQTFDDSNHLTYLPYTQDYDNSSFPPETFGYWTDSSSSLGNVEYQYPVGDSRRPYGWRKITVYRSLSVDDLNEIGSTYCYKDNEGYSNQSNTGDGNVWDYIFSGWTAYRSGVKTAIERQQGDFNYIDATEALAKIDALTDGENSNLGVDGSLPNDNVIYLYPIYTMGQDRSVDKEHHNFDEDKDNLVSNIQLETPSGVNPYFSHEQLSTTIEGHPAFKYELKNIDVSNSQVSNYELLAQFVEWRGATALVGKYAWGNGEKPSTTSLQGSNSLFSVGGTYSITIFVTYWTSYGGFLGLQEEDDVSENTIRNFAIDNISSGIIVNQFWGIAEAKGTGSNTTKRDYAWYVIVQRNYEFHLLGGPYGTFDYDSPNVNRVYPYDFYGYGDDTFDNAEYPLDGLDDTNFSKTFSISGVFVDANGIRASSNHPEAQGSLSSNIFAIGGSNRLWNFPFLSMPESRLTDLNNGLAEGEAFTTINDEDNILSSVSDTDFDEVTTTGINKPSLGNFLKVNETGIYDFRFEVVFDSDSKNNQTVINPDDGVTATITNYIQCIYVAVRRHPTNYFIKVFKLKSDIKSYDPIVSATGEVSRTAGVGDGDNEEGRFVFHYVSGVDAGNTSFVSDAETENNYIASRTGLSYGEISWDTDGASLISAVSDECPDNHFQLVDYVTDQVVYDSTDEEHAPFLVDKCYVLYVNLL